MERTKMLTKSCRLPIRRIAWLLSHCIALRLRLVGKALDGTMIWHNCIFLYNRVPGIHFRIYFVNLFFVRRACFCAMKSLDPRKFRIEGFVVFFAWGCLKVEWHLFGFDLWLLSAWTIRKGVFVDNIFRLVPTPTRGVAGVVTLLCGTRR